MKLVDVMSAAGLSIYAIVALVLFVAAFLAIVIQTFSPGAAARHAASSRLPLSDDVVTPVARAQE